MEYKLLWTEEAVKNLEEILNYLEANWSEKVIFNFRAKLSKQLDLICRNPLIFPQSLHCSRLRKAVLSRQTTIFYEIKGHQIYIAYLFSNKMNISRIK